MQVRVRPDGAASAQGASRPGQGRLSTGSRSDSGPGRNVADCEFNMCETRRTDGDFATGEPNGTSRGRYLN